MEGNIVSLSEHGYNGSLLLNYTCLAYIELLAFTVGMCREGGREKLELKVLGTNVENCFCIQLGNKKYRK